MYHYVDDKNFLSNMRRLSGEIMQDLCHIIKEKYDIGTNFRLVGSGAKNFIMQNGFGSIDLDYNLEIVRCKDFKDCRYLKECVRKAFDESLKSRNLGNCKDSTSVLTSKSIRFYQSVWSNGIEPRLDSGFYSGNRTACFSIDVCIIRRDRRNNYYRLIHKKNGWACDDEYYWNIAPNSSKIDKKVDCIKKRGKWELVKQQYSMIKNKYLSINNEKNHPSFICYVEAVNNVYNSI